MEPKNEPIKLAIVDSLWIFRKGLKTILAPFRDIRIVAEADTGTDLLHCLKSTEVDMIMMEVDMPGMSGIATLKQVKKHYPGINVIMFTENKNLITVAESMREEASTYLLKDTGIEEIYAVIKTVHKKGVLFTDFINKSLLGRIQGKNGHNVIVDKVLNDKEKTILKLMCDEKSTKEIADIVDLSPRTVEAIREKMKTKTGTKSMAGLVMHAVKTGLLFDEKIKVT